MTLAKEPAAPPNEKPLELLRLTRPARALLGWMQRDDAIKAQAGQRADIQLPEYEERASRARRAVAARPPGIDQTSIIHDAPQELEQHIEALRKAQGAAQYFREGWRVCIADLRTVCALQPTVFTDHARERALGVRPDDLRSIAAISLPIPVTSQLPSLFDQAKQSWILSSGNPNLRIVGNWSGQLQPGMAGFGFLVSVMPSFVQVASVSNRYVLRDGYHRAYGFLRAGITTVPVLTREFGPFEDLGLQPGLLPPAAYLGERPPLLTDFLNDEVSGEVVLPALQRTIVIPGLELTTLG